MNNIVTPRRSLFAGILLSLATTLAWAVVAQGEPWFGPVQKWEAIPIIGGCVLISLLWSLWLCIVFRYITWRNSSKMWIVAATAVYLLGIYINFHAVSFYLEDVALYTEQAESDYNELLTLTCESCVSRLCK